MNNKLVAFFDIDGTIYNGKKGIIEPSTIQILKRLKEDENIDIYICTGRSYQTLFEIKDILSLFDGLILNNGGDIHLLGQRYIDTINEDVATNLLTYLNEHQISYGIITKDKEYRRYFKDEIKKVFDEKVASKYDVALDNPSLYAKDIIQLWILETNEHVDKVKAQIKGLNYFYWNNFGCDVTPINRSKALGVQKVMEIMNYNYDNTFAFGDGDNDAPMFDVVKTSVAMGNGSITCLKHALYQTDLIENDGLQKAILKYIYKEIDSLN